MNPIYCVLISICTLTMLTMVLMAKANTTLSQKAKFWFMFKVNLGTDRLGFQNFPAPENLSARGALLS